MKRRSLARIGIVARSVRHQTQIVGAVGSVWVQSAHHRPRPGSTGERRRLVMTTLTQKFFFVFLDLRAAEK